LQLGVLYCIIIYIARCKKKHKNKSEINECEIKHVTCNAILAFKVLYYVLFVCQYRNLSRELILFIISCYRLCNGASFSLSLRIMVNIMCASYECLLLLIFICLFIHCYSYFGFYCFLTTSDTCCHISVTSVSSTYLLLVSVTYILVLTFLITYYHHHHCRINNNNLHHHKHQGFFFRV